MWVVGGQGEKIIEQIRSSQIIVVDHALKIGVACVSGIDFTS